MSRKKGKATTTIYLLINIILYLMIILLNKWIYVNVKFPNVTLSMLHFLFAFLVLHTSEKFNIFVIKTVPIGEILPLAVTFCGLVVFTNLSLQHNSLEMFQLAKILTTPGTILIKICYYGKNFSNKITSAIIPIILGVIINCYYDISINIFGIIFGMLGVILTSIYQVLLSRKQSELQLNSMQLLYLQAPLSTLIIVSCIPLIEAPVQTLSHGWNPFELLMVLISCISAMVYNVTTYWIIENTPATIYNVVGHCKFLLITLGSSIFFDHTISTNQWFGIGVTFFGILLYTGIKVSNESNDEKKTP